MQHVFMRWQQEHIHTYNIQEGPVRAMRTARSKDVG